MDEWDEKLTAQENRLETLADRALAEALGLHFYVVTLERPANGAHGHVHDMKDDSFTGECNALAVTLWLQLKAQVVGRVDDARLKALT
jgi:hypothetical protein